MKPKPTNTPAPAGTSIGAVRGDINVLLRMLRGVEAVAQVAESWESREKEAEAVRAAIEAGKQELATAEGLKVKALATVEAADKEAAELVKAAHEAGAKIVEESKVAARTVVDDVRGQVQALEAVRADLEAEIKSLVGLRDKEARALEDVQEQARKVKASLEGVLAKVG